MAEIQIGEAITYPTREAKWGAKGGLLALISFIPVLNFAAVGYEVEIARRVALRETPVLPEWSDLSGLFRRGLPLALARYLYFLPVSLVAGVAFFAGAASLFTIDTDYAAWGTVLGTLCGGGLLLSLALGFLVAAVSPAVTVRYLEGGTFASCFDWPGIWRHFRQHTPAHLAVFGWILAVSIGLALLVAPASVFLSFIPCLGAIAYPLLYAVLIAVLLFIFSHLEGQLFRAVLS